MVAKTRRVIDKFIDSDVKSILLSNSDGFLKLEKIEGCILVSHKKKDLFRRRVPITLLKSFSVALKGQIYDFKEGTKGVIFKSIAFFSYEDTFIGIPLGKIDNWKSI